MLNSQLSKYSVLVSGIPATCQDYLDEGYTLNHTYIIDPDGPYTELEGKSNN